MTTPAEIRTTISTAENLDDLCEILSAYKLEYDDDELSLDEVVDLTSLPTFGGREPVDTSGIWSWDSERLLVSDASHGFAIISREDW